MKTSAAASLTPYRQVTISIQDPDSNSSRRRIINPALKLKRSSLVINLLISTRLENLAESRVEIRQQRDQHEARKDVFRVHVHDAVDVDEVGGWDGELWRES
jgi:hypothetical protein